MKKSWIILTIKVVPEGIELLQYIQKQSVKGECIHYGASNALAIVTSLLIDRSVESLGHSKTCPGYFTELGVPIQPHKGYGENSVLDFR